MDNDRHGDGKRGRRIRYSAGAQPYHGNTTEKIRVYAKIVKGKTVCICHAGKKGCNEECQADVVTRDRYFGWEETFRRNRYGK